MITYRIDYKTKRNKEKSEFLEEITLKELKGIIKEFKHRGLKIIDVRELKTDLYGGEECFSNMSIKCQNCSNSSFCPKYRINY